MVTKDKPYVEYGGCVDIEEHTEDVIPRMMENLIRRSIRRMRNLSESTMDWGLAFAYSEGGHLEFISSLAYNDKVMLPTLKERLTRKGYTDILTIDAATILNLAKGHYQRKGDNDGKGKEDQEEVSETAIQAAALGSINGGP